MAEPTHISKYPDDVDTSAAEVGARLLGWELYEQSANVARVCEAKGADGFPMYPTVAVLMPRRSTKTTGLWALVLGRCATIPGYRAVVTAQDGTRAGNKMREMMNQLEAQGFVESGVGTFYRSNGKERINFANGSAIWVVPPSAAAFRGEAADCLLFDEAGELDPVKSADLLTGALPLLDTRPMGQAIIAGTPASGRVGLLWETLEEARDGEPTTGIVDYSIRDDEEAIAEDEAGRLTIDDDVLMRVHPGIGTLTTLAKIKANLRKMGRLAFEREYLCRFPFDNSVLAISGTKWAECADVYPGELPERIALGYSVNIDSSSAALAAAWRDEDGKAHIASIKHAHGWQWLADEAVKASRKYNRAHIGYNAVGANTPVAELIGRTKPVATTAPKGLKQMVSGTQTLVGDIHRGLAVQYDQPALQQAVDGATWRELPEGGRTLGWKASGVDISPLEAAVCALHTFDNLPKKSEVFVISG